MKRLPVFLLGVTFGVIVTIYYELASRQPQPKIVKHNLVMRYVDFDDLYPLEDAQPTIQTYPNGKPKSIPWREAMKSLGDTQPVRVDTSGGPISPGTPYIVGDDDIGEL